MCLTFSDFHLSSRKPASYLSIASAVCYKIKPIGPLYFNYFSSFGDVAYGLNTFRNVIF